MALVACHPPRAQWSHGLSGLALLLFLTGCAAQPPLRPSAGQRAIRVNLEVSTPQRSEELRLSGVQLPQVAQGTADPRAHPDFIDHRMTAVAFGVTVGGYLLYCEGLPLPVFVPESHVALGLESTQPLNASIYPDWDAAQADLSKRAPGSAHARYAWYRGAGGALIVPTVFSPATTPRIAQTMREARKHLSERVQAELKVVLLTLSGTKVLQGVFSYVVRASAGAALRPLPQERGFGGGAPAPRQPVPRAATPAPQPAPAPAAPTPAPTSLAPSPALVRALTGNNPTPQVPPGPRLPQDAAVKPSVPRLLPPDRSIGPSPSQNAQLRADIRYLELIGARNIRVNQQQVTHKDGQRTGVNRPDLQFDYQGRRYHVEYDTPTSGRGSGHQRRIVSNDPDAEIILLIVP
jgi:hypothetical protein